MARRGNPEIPGSHFRRAPRIHPSVCNPSGDAAATAALPTVAPAGRAVDSAKTFPNAFVIERLGPGPQNCPQQGKVLRPNVHSDRGLRLSAARVSYLA
jgi:hypothetical protein